MSQQAALQKQQRSKEWSWPLWPVVPLYPYGNRRTLRTELVKDTIWAFDQLQGILYVTVPVRMTVVKLEAGGLLVYAPVAPTPECIRLMRDLESQHGAVRYVILPTASGLEHKVFVGPFARRFPQAIVYVVPDQWSFPLKLPLSWLGFPIGRTYPLPRDAAQAPFYSDFDYDILGPIRLGLGTFEEVAFLHRRSHTLLVTDTVLAIPTGPPDIVQLTPYSMLFHARDHVTDAVDDTWENRCKGWQRIVLFSFYFRPSTAKTIPLKQAIRDATHSSDRSRANSFGIFPFQWDANWKQSFDALRNNGQLLVAPILQTLILNRAPKQTLDWVDRVASWDFQRIIPCHFEQCVTSNGSQFREAFAFLRPSLREASSLPKNFSDDDLSVLKELDDLLTRRGITPPPESFL
ncbi:MAG: DUF4336 domain-containing protein [Leptolyngbyaceae bacterium]|nr:DUF4336 domain-containing protein [Leptolyngbyaceae bacterium]